jgi:dienelactone hydrolase
VVWGRIAALSIGLVACGLEDADRGVKAKDLSSQMSLSAENGANQSPLLRRVPPLATDAALAGSSWLEDHYVWLDSGHSNGKLFVFMVGNGNTNSQFQLLPQEAARLGYRVIVLTYPNSWGIRPVCANSPDRTCQESVRREIIDGIDRTPVITVQPVDGIDNRLTKVLQFLAASYPEEEWSRFLHNSSRTRGTPKWSKIAVGGFSFGGMQAALIGKLRDVNRVAIFGATNDGSGGVAGNWVAPGETSPERYYGLLHRQDSMIEQGIPNWTALGLLAFGPFVREDETGAAPPYGGTHALMTDRLPMTGNYANAHGSVARDDYTPRATDGTPLLRDAWRYVLAARHGDHDGDSDDGRVGEGAND